MAEKLLAGRRAIVFEDHKLWINVFYELAREHGFEISSVVTDIVEVDAAINNPEHKLRTSLPNPELAFIGGALVGYGGSYSHMQARKEVILARIINPSIVTIGVSGLSLEAHVDNLDFDPSKPYLPSLDFAEVAQLVQARIRQP